jgi:transcriptional regulator of arginine metabolism
MVQVTLLEQLRQILIQKGVRTQAELKAELERCGYEVNQSTISRSLRKLGVIKAFSPDGEAFYQLLDSEEGVPAVQSSVSDLVTQIQHNESLIVIHTSPGSASLIARSLDHFNEGQILGTIAGDDTIFVAAMSGRSLPKLVIELKEFFAKAE